MPEAPINRPLELPLSATRHPPTRRSIVTASLPHDAAATDGRVFVADEFGHAVSVLAGGREIRRITGFAQPGGKAAVGKDVALVVVGADVVTLIDGRSLRVLGDMAIGSGISHDVAGPDGRLYVADTRGGALFTLATRPRLRLLSRLRLPGTPYGLASAPIRRRLWVTETATNTVAELDVSRPRPRVIATFPKVRQPDTVAVDSSSGRVFVAGASAGVVQFFDPPHMHSLR